MAFLKLFSCLSAGCYGVWTPLNGAVSPQVVTVCPVQQQWGKRSVPPYGSWIATSTLLGLGIRGMP